MHVAQAELAGSVAISLAFRFLAKCSVFKSDLAFLLFDLHLLIIRVLRTISISNISWDVFLGVALFLFLFLSATFLSQSGSFFLAILLFLSTLGFGGTIHSELSPLEDEVLFLNQRFLHLIFRFKHDVANTLTKVSLGVSDQSDIFYFATVDESSPQLFLTHNKRQVADENRLCKVLPRIYERVAATFRQDFLLSFLFSQGKSTCVHTNVSLFEKHLVEFDFGILTACFFFVKDVGILAVLKIAQLFRDNLCALRLLGVLNDADGAEPNLFNFATGPEKLLESLGCGVDGHIAYENCALFTIFQLEC